MKVGLNQPGIETRKVRNRVLLRILASGPFECVCEQGSHDGNDPPQGRESNSSGMRRYVCAGYKESVA